ncbi:MAG: hypothetical protein KAT83_02610 [Candidatus Aenigmarchaeota archaeon]|nr:hypothetical protein [Candidatus Aenigmarchaeota archaeon]
MPDSQPPVYPIAYRPSAEKHSRVENYFGVEGTIDELLTKLGEHDESAKPSCVGSVKLISPTKIIGDILTRGRYSVEDTKDRVIPVDTTNPIGGDSGQGVGPLKSSYEGVNNTISLESSDGSINGILKTFIHYNFVSAEGAVSHVFIDELVLEKNGNSKKFGFRSTGNSYNDGLFAIQDGGNKTQVFVQTTIGDYKNRAVMKRGGGLENPLYIRDDTGKTNTPVTDTVVAYIKDKWKI